MPPDIGADKKAFSLFKKKEAEKPESAMPNIQQSINSLDVRLKMIESRHNDLSRKAQLMDRNMLDERKRFTNEFRVLSSDILDLKRQINSIQGKLDMIISELKGSARKEELDALSKYIDLWDPVNFVTRNEVEKIVREIVEDRAQKKNNPKD